MGYYDEGGTFDIRHEAFIDERYELREPEVSDLSYEEAVAELKELSDRILANDQHSLVKWSVAHRSDHVLMIFHDQYSHTYAIIKHDPTAVPTVNEPRKVQEIPISDDTDLVVWSDNTNLIHISQYDGAAIFTPEEAFKAGQELVAWAYNRVIGIYQED